MSESNGRFVWYDLMTTDLEAADAFYSSVIGWTIADSGMEGPPYRLLSMGSTMVGGLMPIPDEARKTGAQPAWMGYIGVEDVDAFAVRVKDAGGAIHREAADIPNVGRFAVAADPHGAVFILFHGTGQPQVVTPGQPGSIGWHELHAGELEAAWAFYSGLFGWTKDMTVDMGPMGLYQTFATGKEPVGGMMTKLESVPMPFWAYYFNVDGVDAAITRTKEAGGTVIQGPHQVPGGSWIAHCLDPQGAFFALTGMTR